jgi:glucokinase
MMLGLEIGGTKLQLVLGDERANILQRRKLAVDAKAGAAGLQQQIRLTLSEMIEQGITKVGVGFGGPVDWRTGKICRSHQVEGWSDFDLAGWLRELTNAPVAVDNDANVGALGEARNGAGAGFDPVFYVTLGSGVGGGLVVGGNIYHGAIPGEAEIGHVRLDRSGAIVESRCSGWAVDAKVRTAATAQPRSVLAQLSARSPGAEGRHLLEAIRRQDATASSILAETAEDLAFGLSHVTHLFHPAVIILGGGLSKLGEPLRCAVETHLQRFTMEAFSPGPRILLSALGEDAVPIGALELARQR